MKEKILLLTDIPPCTNYTGGIMLSQLVRFLIEEKIDVEYYSIEDPYLNAKIDTTVSDEVKLIRVNRPNEIISKKNTYNNFSKKLKAVIKSVKNYISSNSFSKIWIVIQGEVMTEIAYHIMNDKNYKYIVQIWDPIEWWTKEHKFDKEREKKVLNKHDEVLKNAECCITTSEAMTEYFNKKLGINCIEVMPPLKKVNFVSSKTKKEKDKFVIAMSGQVYSQDELEALFLALDSMSWKIGDKKIYFEHYGSWYNSQDFINEREKYKDRIICHGFVHQSMLLSYLSNADLLYCPYFFSKDKALKKVSELSFPSKLITYLSLDVPVLMHGPNYASPVKFLEKYNAGYVITSDNPNDIAKKLTNIASLNSKEILINARKVFESNFTYEVVKNNFFKALNIGYDNEKKLHILEVNNVDLSGRRFNGYDLLEEINTTTNNQARQIVVYKSSDNDDVKTFYPNNRGISLDWTLIDNEQKELSVHSQLSLTSNILKNNDYFINADLVHYHLIHNTKLSLYQMIELCSNKPSVFTLHDPWNFTGRCVYPQECEKWKTGCHNCQYLNTLFPFLEDNCHSLWKLKKYVYENLDVDIVVSTKFMKEMIETSPLTKCFKHVHVIPFGIDLEKFKKKLTKEEARKKLKLPVDDVVIFFRSQMAAKGTEYIVEAMKQLKTNKKITLLSCSEIGNLDSLKDKYNVVDLGNIDNDKMFLAYDACDFFLMPSRGESFGLMAIEAMAFSKTVVVFNNTSLPEVTFAPDCGVLVENKNSKKLMEAIKMLIDNPEECERRGNLGRKLAEENYDIKVYNDRIKKMYNEAYKRQKDKPVKMKEMKIDYNLIDVKILAYKLKKIYKNMYHIDMKDDIFKNIKEISLPNYKIDYSNINVQNLIYQFNLNIYKKYLEIEASKTNKYTKGFFNMLRYDREHLLVAIDNRLKKIPVLYPIIKIIANVLYFVYRIFRRLKRILFNDYANKAKKDIEELNKVIDNLSEEIASLKYENELLNNEILQLKKKSNKKV